jgi:hypothetical protein
MGNFGLVVHSFMDYFDYPTMLLCARIGEYLGSWRQMGNLKVWRACNLTAFIHSSTGPVVHPFTSCHEGPKFNPHGGTYVKPGFSC